MNSLETTSSGAHEEGGLSEADFHFVADFVRQRAAIVIGPDKQYLVRTRLLPLAAREGVAGLAELIEQVRRQPFGRMADGVIQALTTNETYFFRDLHPFDAFRDHVMPELIQRRARERSFTIWCAAASTGQEPYSLAMIIRDSFPEIMSWSFKFVSSDISNDVLAKARSGTYTQLEVNRGLPITLLVKHFEQKDGNWVLKPSVREMVDFQQVNLAGAWPQFPPLDVVFMRNVLIYFDRETKSEILTRVHRLMRPDGALFLGASESTLSLCAGFEPVSLGQTTCYRPVNAGAAN